ncbi:MAG TPA: putative glycoside hydrolase, partial [Terriglobales bacterium]|nr:putative glycoside hydrolase [Terriglobales bacterium]
MRPSSVRIITASSCLLFGAAAWWLGPHSKSDFVAQAQTAKTAQVQPVSASIPSTATLKPLSELEVTSAPGTEIYTAKRGEAIPTVARHYLGRTSYLTSSELADAIRSVNHRSDSSNILKADERIVIPGILAAPITEKTIPVPREFEVRAVYLTGVMAASDHGLRIIRRWREVGGNAVVFDIKDSDGSVNIPFEHPLLGEHKVYIHDVPKFVHFLHQQNMHAIARIAIFRDQRMVTEHPELAVQSRRNHTAWRENGKLVWTDPSQPKVQDYNIALAKHVAQLGVDEIQFDYVRFPAEGDQKDASFVFQKDQPDSGDAVQAKNDDPGAESPKPEAEAK